MDETIKKDVIARAMTEMECYTECYPVIREDVAIQEYTKVPLGQLSAMGVILKSGLSFFASGSAVLGARWGKGMWS